MKQASIIIAALMCMSTAAFATDKGTPGQGGAGGAGGTGIGIGGNQSQGQAQGQVQGQVQGQGQSQISKNTNTNANVNANSNSNRNSVESSNRNSNRNSSTANGGNTSSNASGGNNGQSQEVNNSGVGSNSNNSYQSGIPVSSATAPSFAIGGCQWAVSGGAQFFGFGASGGGAGMYEFCKSLMKSKHFRELNNAAVAKALECQDSSIRAAYKEAGQACAADLPRGAPAQAAAAPSAPALAPGCSTKTVGTSTFVTCE